MGKTKLKLEGAGERFNVRFPRWLADDLRRLVPPRKRSQVIVAGTAQMVSKLKQEAALRAGAGAWSDENHPELVTQEDVERYLKELRASTQERFET